jgi:hypothetical protein
VTFLKNGPSEDSPHPQIIKPTTTRRVSAISRPTCGRPTNPYSEGVYEATRRSVEVGSVADPLEGTWQNAECRAVSRQGSRFCNADRTLASD